MNRTLVTKIGGRPEFGHHEDEELVVFRPWARTGPAFVNVDATSKKGILRAQELGLVPSGLADVIFTNNPSSSIEHLYDSSHKGRVLGLFRHPVERLISKFYYLQMATWETSYKPEWKETSILEFATKMSHDQNHMVKKLVRKASVTRADLKIAIRTVNERFIVGLVNQMEESIHRFNIVMGIDEADEDNRKCMDKFLGEGGEKENSNSHPKVEEDSLAWRTLAEKNALDIILYNHILLLFQKQKEIIESHAESMAAAQWG